MERIRFEMSTSGARRFLIYWWLKRQMRKMEKETYSFNAARGGVAAYHIGSVDLRPGTGSSVTFRDEPLLPKTYADEVE